MELPAIITNKEWEDLKPKEIDLLGRRNDLDPEQDKLLQIFRVIDLRVEWSCRQTVITRNALVFLFIAFLAVNGVQLHSWIFK